MNNQVIFFKKQKKTLSPNSQIKRGKHSELTCESEKAGLCLIPSPGALRASGEGLKVSSSQGQKDPLGGGREALSQEKTGDGDSQAGLSPQQPCLGKGLESSFNEWS